MKWLSAFILLAMLGITKAHHIKLLLLALLGLAGLYWMQNNRPSAPKALFDIATKILTKRDLNRNVDIDWELVIKNDQSTCAKSYVCQLAVANTENFILDNIMYSEKQEWALREIKAALNFGLRYKDGNMCVKNYKLCPYSMKQMQQLLRFFNNKYI